MLEVIKRIDSLNPTRKQQDIIRRLCKIYEEFGELNQALLNLTSRKNPKNKTTEDVLEELVDVAIMAYDIALTFSVAEDLKDPDFKLILSKEPDLVGLMPLMNSIIWKVSGDLSKVNIGSYSEPAKSCMELAYVSVELSKTIASETDIIAMFTKKLDKWEGQVKLGKDLCPTK